MTAAVEQQYNWQAICKRDDLVAGSGVCALIGREQVALFYLPEEDDKIFALDNRDPVSEANVISRGLVGDISGRLVVASPLYKQHFDLFTGECLEDEGLNVQAYKARLDGNTVLLAL